MNFGRLLPLLLLTVACDETRDGFSFATADEATVETVVRVTTGQVALDAVALAGSYGEVGEGSTCPSLRREGERAIYENTDCGGETPGFTGRLEVVGDLAGSFELRFVDFASEGLHVEGSVVRTGVSTVQDLTVSHDGGAEVVARMTTICDDAGCASQPGAQGEVDGEAFTYELRLREGGTKGTLVATGAETFRMSLADYDGDGCRYYLVDSVLDEVCHAELP